MYTYVLSFLICEFFSRSQCKVAKYLVGSIGEIIEERRNDVIGQIGFRIK